MREFRKQARKHGNSCELCPPDGHGRRPDAVVTMCNVRCCEAHATLVLVIVRQSQPAREFAR